MITADRMLREIEDMRAEASAGAVKNPNFDVSLEFGYGVAHGRDQAFQMVSAKLVELISAEEDKEGE